MTAHTDLQHAYRDGFYTSVINSIPIGAAALNAELIIADVNQALDNLLQIDGCAFLGMPIERMLEAVLAADEAGTLTARFYSALGNQDTFVTEIHPRHRADDSILSLTASPLLENNGEQVGLVLTLEDITERKRAEEALKRAHDDLEQRIEQRTAELRQTNTRLQREIGERRRAQEALHERRRTLHLIISSMPNLMLLIDEDDHITAFFVPPHFQPIANYYHLDMGRPLLSIMPEGVANSIAETLEVVRRTGRLQSFEHKLRFEGQVRYMRIKVTAVQDSRDVLVLVDDVTELKLAEEALQRRDAILETLAYASEQLMLADPDDVLPNLIAYLGSAIHVSRAYVFENWTDDGDLRARCRYRWFDDEQSSQHASPPIDDFSYAELGLERWVDLLSAGQPLQGMLSEFPPGERELLGAKGIQSLALVPIFSNGEWWGYLGFGQDEHKRAWLGAELEALRSAASAIGAAISRQRIQEAERAQRTLAEALRDLASTLNSTLDFDEVVDRILANIGRVVPHDTGDVMLLDGELVHVIRTTGSSAAERNHQESTFRLDDFPNLQKMAEHATPIIVQDVHHSDSWVTLSGSEWIRSYAGAPICMGDDVIGFLNLYSRTVGFFNEEHAERLQAFADQAAAAIKNARLYEQAQALAAIEERQRLARELHDGVSQSLGSATLIADVLPRIWQQNPNKGERALEQLRELTGNALAEMRMLLMELRPDALVEASLDDLLGKLCQAMSSRLGVPIALSISGSVADVPVNVKLALYRVAQEALNNVVKHALASEVSVQLRREGNLMRLHIVDNGRGFDPADVPSDHFGLSIMQERIAGISGTIALDSEIGKGTSITAACPV